MSDNGTIFGTGDCTLSVTNPFNSAVIVLTLRHDVNWFRGKGYRRTKRPQTIPGLTAFRQPTRQRTVAGGLEKHLFALDLLLSDDEKQTLEDIFAVYDNFDGIQLQFADNRLTLTEPGNLNTRALASGSVEVRPNGTVKYFAQFNIQILDIQGMFAISDETLLGSGSSVAYSGGETGVRNPLWRVPFTAIEGTKILAP